MLRTIIYFHVYIIYDIRKYFNALSIRSACLHKTVNMVVFFIECNENTYPKGRALMQRYIVVPIKTRGN